MAKEAPRYIRQYVDVEVTFDTDGRMRPRIMTSSFTSLSMNFTKVTQTKKP